MPKSPDIEQIENTDIESDSLSSSRGQLLRRALTFQAKLFVDGLRDLVLSPISFVAALLGIILYHDTPQKLFNKVMSFGRRSEQWIDLFECHEQSDTSENNFETLLADVEKIVTDQAESRPVSAKALQKARQALRQIDKQINKAHSVKLK